MASGVMVVRADTALLAAQCRDLVLLGLEAGDIPECVLDELRGLLDDLGHELAFASDVPALGASQVVVRIGFREGGKFDSCAAALRALRDGRKSGHVTQPSAQ